MILRINYKVKNYNVNKFNIKPIDNYNNNNNNRLDI